MLVCGATYRERVEDTLVWVNHSPPNTQTRTSCADIDQFDKGVGGNQTDSPLGIEIATWLGCYNFMHQPALLLEPCHPVEAQMKHPVVFGELRLVPDRAVAGHDECLLVRTVEVSGRCCDHSAERTAVVIVDEGINSVKPSVASMENV